MSQLPRCQLRGDWSTLFLGRSKASLEKALPAFLSRHRWFGGKARSIRQVQLMDAIELVDVPEITQRMRRPGRRTNTPLAKTFLLLVKVEYLEGQPEFYAAPVVFAQGEQETGILADRPGAGIITLERLSSGEQATLCDSSQEHEFWALIFDVIKSGRMGTGLNGELSAETTSAMESLIKRLAERCSPMPDILGSSPDIAPPPPPECQVRLIGAEQSNSSAVIGQTFVLKLFRRLCEGTNPEWEIGQFLTEESHEACIPKVGGALTYTNHKGTRYTLAVLHEFVPEAQDAWTFTLDELDRFLERVTTQWRGQHVVENFPAGDSYRSKAQVQPDELTRQALGSSLQTAETLGAKVAQLHQALARGTAKEFRPEPFTKLYQRGVFQAMQAHAQRTFLQLKRLLHSLAPSALESAARLLTNEKRILAQFRPLAQRPISALRIRCHGDLHLGQVLYSGRDVLIIDFEGEPHRSIDERKIKTTPLRDVAGMLRSFHYACAVARNRKRHDSLATPDSHQNMTRWLEAWREWVSASFIKGYLQVADSAEFLPKDSGDFDTLLDAYLLDKAFYELDYELNNRPDWVCIPMEGIAHLTGALIE